MKLRTLLHHLRRTGLVLLAATMILGVGASTSHAKKNKKKRTVLYMTPCRGHFLVGFALGEKAVKAAHGSTLPLSVLAVIDEARKYAEGRGVRIEIRNRKDLEASKQLATIKMEN